MRLKTLDERINEKNQVTIDKISVLSKISHTVVVCQLFRTTISGQ